MSVASRSPSALSVVPLFSGVMAIAEHNRSGGMGSNQEHFAPSTHVEPGVDRVHEIVLYDPQTSEVC